MEAPGMGDDKNAEHATSAAAFVEGGIQDACDDACSICLEAFCDSDPSTVTSCKHEFHLQCILEWCQRSSNCPMCWQPISLKDSASQELLEAVEQERNFRLRPARNTTIFHHPTLGDFELQHLPVGMGDADLEDRIIQHLAAAAAMGRAHHIARRESSRSRSAAHGHPQFLLFSSHPTGTADGSVSASLSSVGAEHDPVTGIANSSVQLRPVLLQSPQRNVQLSSLQTGLISGSSSGSAVNSTNDEGVATANRGSSSQSSCPNQDRAGPSDFQSLSESWKSRLNAMSMKYKESISKSTRGWKEKLFSRSSSMADIGTEVKREVNAGIATVSRMMERLETRENRRTGRDSGSNNIVGSSVTEHHNHDNLDARSQTPDNKPAPFAASSASQ